MTTTGAKKPNSVDVARIAKVSRATVSYVLNGKSDGLVSDETCKRVYAAAEQIGYRVNSLAKGLKSGRTDLIGVYCKVREDAFHSRLLHGISDLCYEQGFNVIITYLNESEQVGGENLNRMLDFNVSGIIRIVSDRLGEGEADLLGHLETPAVLIDDSSHGDTFDFVISDNAQGTRLAVNHLVGFGHTRIGHVNIGNVSNKGRAVRREAFRSAMAAGGLPSDVELIDGSCDIPYEAIQRFLGRPGAPTALFCTNDNTASAVREAARDIGIRVPDDLAICGFGDTDIARTGGLTSVHEDAEAMGRCAVEQLLRRKATPGRAPASIVMPTRLVARASTLGKRPAATHGKV